MKTNLILSLALLFEMFQPCCAQNLAYADSKVEESAAPSVVNIVDAPVYRYSVYGEIPAAEVLFPEEHFLGGEITVKWNTFQKNYVHEYSVEVGLADSGVEFLKPTVYKAVERANRYLKKSVKKGAYSKQQAAVLLSHILDCANVICYESDTENFEQAAKSAKTGEEVIGLFNRVQLVKN